ncbi:hypothetical protein SCG7109_AC_00200 [Chlamydiales bacterium SCGC AG-110-M15]|nr:hypothetical protein SCG7109_AC_00200 [Chlamydiales bacterium SCGC AG-110-M15]
MWPSMPLNVLSALSGEKGKELWQNDKASHTLPFLRA